MLDVSRHSTTALHPLEPLMAGEITTAMAILRRDQPRAVAARVSSVHLAEPSKDIVRGFRPGDPTDRRALVVLLDRSDGATYEAVVSITSDEVISWNRIDGAQPSIMVEEFFAAADAVKADPGWQQAMRARGITDVSLVQVDPWSAGNFGLGIDEDLRLVRAMTYLRDAATDNAYAHPVEGLIAFVDLNRNEVVRLEDHGAVPVPTEPGNYDIATVGALRPDLKPLDITQPEGSSWEISGNEVAWQNWRFRFSLHPNEGLVLHRVGYVDGGTLRPILHRASLADMVVPYGDPSPTHAWKLAFDASEYGLGKLVNALELGCDCLGEIQYFDAVLADENGEPYTLPNAICMHEEDFGILWKHFDFRAETSETRRSRRLVISCIATVGNYEYGFYWYFYLDGTIQLEVKLTGIIQTGALAPGETTDHGSLVAPNLYGPNHQHFFNVRLDFELDGAGNSVHEVDVVADEPGPDNPLGNAFRAHRTLIASEAASARVVDASKARYWTITNPSVTNRLGQPVGYKLVPGYTATLLAQPDSVTAKRAAFTTANLWVTAFDEAELHPAGDYTNQHPGGAGLPSWIARDRPLENADVVAWHTFGATHIVRPEDWPVMPVETTGFTLKPLGFFDRNPALDVPPSTNGHCHP
jgi:primary-amine oxidase